MATLQVKVKHDGWNIIKKVVSRFKSFNVDVDFEGSKEGIPMAQIVKWLEEGHINGGRYDGTFTPPRPFINSIFMPRAKKLIDTKYVPLLGNNLFKGIAINSNVHAELVKELEDLMKQVIDEYDVVPNSKLTSRLKGTNNPLVETGGLKNSVKARARR